MTLLNDYFNNKKIINPNLVNSIAESSIFISQVGTKADIDLDTENIKTGVEILGKIGTYDIESINPISESTVLENKVGFVNGEKIIGSITNQENNNVEVTNLTGASIPEGYYDGTGLAILSSGEIAKVIAENIVDGITILGVLGTATGSGLDTSDADAIAADILNAKTAYVNGIKLEGSMPINVAAVFTIDTAAEELDIGIGYHDGTEVAKIAAIEVQKIIPENIVDGVTILGVLGTAVTGGGTHVRYEQEILMSAPALTETMTAKLLYSLNTCTAIMNHGIDSVFFIVANQKSDDSEVYMVGGVISDTGVMSNFYYLTFTVAEDVATITSIKTSAGVEDITNWSADSGIVYITEEAPVG